MELKILQLTLAKIAQLGRHETVNTRSERYRRNVCSVHFRSKASDANIGIIAMLCICENLEYNSSRTTRMIYFRENSIQTSCELLINSYPVFYLLYRSSPVDTLEILSQILVNKPTYCPSYPEKIGLKFYSVFSSDTKILLFSDLLAKVSDLNSLVTMFMLWKSLK